MEPERYKGENPEDRGDIADAYAPPPLSRRRTVFWTVLAILAVCILVFVIALALR